MPRKRSRVVINCVQTSSKQNDEDGTSKVSVASHISASSQATLDGDKADQASIQEPLPSRPPRAAKVKCHEQLLVDACNNSCYVTVKEQHLKRKAQNVSKSRCNESVEVRKQRVKKKRKYSAMMISKETPEQRERRLERMRRYKKKKAANESVELRKQHLEKRRKYSAILRSKESDEHRERRLERMRRNNNKRKANETVEDRKRRLEYNREYTKKYKANETAEQRERRLEKGRQYDLLRRTNPNVEQRELRRQKQREYLAKCKAKKRIKKYGERAKNRQKRASRARIEQYYITEDSDDDFESIKSETSNEETERFFFSFASTSISDPLLAPRPTRAAKVKCLQQISEAVSEDSSGDESPLANLRRFQQQQVAEVQGRLKEIQQCGPKCGVKDSSEQREPSEDKLRQLAIKSVDALRVKCQKINIRQYVPKYRIKNSVVKDEQHLPKTIEDGIQTVSENVEKHELQEESTRIASETIEQHEQASEKQHEVYLRDKEGDSKDAGKHIKAIEEIKSEASNQEYDQLCEVTTSEGIEYPKCNVKGEDNKLCECDPLGGVSGINVKSEDNVLEGEYEVQKFKSKFIMPRKRSRVVTNCVHTSRKQDGEDGASQVSVTSHSSASSGSSSRPTHAAKVKCHEQLLVGASNNSESAEDDEQHLKRKAQNVSKSRCNESVEQRERRLERMRRYVKTKKANETAEQRERRLERIRRYIKEKKANETAEQRERRLEKGRQYDLLRRTNPNVEKRELRRQKQRKYVAKCKAKKRIKKYGERAKNRQKHASRARIEQCKQINAIEEIKSEASNQEYDQLCEVTTSEGIEYPKRNVNGEDNKLCECDPLVGISGINVKSEDNVLEEEYEVQKVIKMEIDIESEGPQQIKPKDRTKSMVDAITVKGINDIVQKQRKRNKHNATNTLTTRRGTGKKLKKKLRSAPQQSLEKPRQDGPILIHDRNFVRGSYQNILLQYVLSSRTENSVAQGEKHLLKLIECVSTQTANDHVDHNHQFPSKYKPNESVEQRQLYPDTEKQPCTIQLKDDLIDEQRNEYAQQHYLNLKPNENVEEREQSPDKASQYQSKLMANETVEQSAKNMCQDGPVGVAPVNKLREPLRNDNIGQCELEHQDRKPVENHLQCPDKLPQDEPESRVLETFQLIQPHRTIYIQQYVPEQQIGETDEQHQQRIEKLRSELICKVNECIDKYERQNEESNSAITLNTVSNAEKRLKTHPENRENLYDKSNPEEVNQILQNLRQRVASKSIQRYPITKSTMHGSYVFDKEITSGPSKEKHKQLCEVTASEGVRDPKPNMNGDVVYEFDSLDIITSNTIRTGDTVVEEKYEVRRVLNMEIDVESKGVQLTTLNENNLMTENSKVQDIIDDVMQNLLEEQQKDDVVNTTCTDTTTENRCSEKLHKYLANESSEQRENCLERLVDGQKCIPNERAEQCLNQREYKTLRFHQTGLNNIKNGARSIANESFVQSEQPCTLQCLIYENAKRQRLLKENRNNKARSQIANETDEHRQRRLEKKRQYYLTKVKGKRFSNESAEKREQRLRKINEYRLKRNANETVEQRERRLEKIRQYVAKRRANPTEQCERVRIRQREYPKICNTKKKNEKLVQCPEYLQQNGSSGNVEQYHAEEDIKYDSVKEMKSGPCQEQKQLCEVTASKSIADPMTNSNCKANILHEFVSIDSIRGGESTASDNVENKLKKKRVLEINVETKDHAEEDIKYDSVKEIESAPCQEQKQFCEVTASKSIPDQKPNSNSKANVLHEFV